MSSVIKVNACVYSRIGYGREENTNAFYMNGKFISEQHIGNLQASMENRGNEYLFAIADNMNCTDEDSDANVSILKEIGRFHEKITVNGGELKSKIKELQSRVGDTERLVESFLDMNRVPTDHLSRGLGFSSILLTDGQFAAASSGNCKVFMMRDGMFRPLASETSKAKQLLVAKGNADGDENQDVVLPDEDPNASVIISDIYDLAEGDSFLLVSNGILEALGEEKIEDLLSLRSDSSYITYRLVDEAMKRKFSGDLTAMVVQVEKIYESSAPSRKSSSKPDQMKTRVDRLNKTPAVSYKYNRKKSGRFQGSLFIVFFVLTVLVLFGIIFVIIQSIMNTGKENFPDATPTVTARVTPEPTPTVTGVPTNEPDDPVIEDPTPTPTPTQQASSGEVKIHKVKKGDTIGAICRQYYGTDSLASALCAYNGITDPNRIQIGQEIKIPPKDELQ
jgi:LysM repeat protein